MQNTESSKSSESDTSPEPKTIRLFLPLVGIDENTAAMFLMAYNGASLDAEPEVGVLTILFLCKAMMSCRIDMAGVLAIVRWIGDDMDSVPFVQILNNDRASLGDREECLCLRTFDSIPLCRDVFISTAFAISLMRDKAHLWLKATAEDQH